MSKVLDSILTLKSDMAASWTREFDRINIWEDVRLLYEQGWSQEFANRVVAYIVLAYDNESGWIETHKDRIENKQKIMQRLGGDLRDEVTKQVIHDLVPEVAEVVAWFIAYQQDWRWDTIITCFQYHANMMRFANSTVALDDEEDIPEDDEEAWHELHGRKKKKKKAAAALGEDKMAAINLKKGDAIQKAIEQRRKGDEMWTEIQKEFVKLDAVLVKEGKQKATDAVDILSHEKYIQKRNAARKDTP